MLKDETYHEAAIQYNTELAEFAEDLAKRVDHREVSKWSKAVSKQHRYHADQHVQALERLKNKKEAVVDEPADEAELHTVEPEDDQIVHRSAETGQFVTEEFSDENPETTVEETIKHEPVPVVEPTHNHAADGVFHKDCAACGTSSTIFQEASE